MTFFTLQHSDESAALPDHMPCLLHHLTNPQLLKGALSYAQQRQAGKGGLDCEGKQKAHMGSHDRFATPSVSCVKAGLSSIHVQRHSPATTC